MEYQIKLKPRAEKELNKIPVSYRSKIIASLLTLSNNPYRGKRLKGEYKKGWSLKVWPYRVIYRIMKREFVILIIKIGHRQRAY